MSKAFNLALIGNPNSGKTTLFNGLTGARQKIGNWSGVTVEKKTGHFSHGDTQFNVVDLPGTYSLHVSHEDDSVDQQIAQKFILEEPVDLLINIIDASSLERGLYLTTQLLDTEVPMVIALNMMDVAHQQGTHIDPHKLSVNIGVPVIPIIASRKEGLGSLADVIINHLTNESGSTEASSRKSPVILSEALETAITKIQQLIGGKGANSGRMLATAILERDDSAFANFSNDLQEKFNGIIKKLEGSLDGQAADLLINARYDWVTTALAGVMHHDRSHQKTLTDRLDNIFLNRLLAFPLLLAVMYLMFMFTINFGGAFIDFFDLTAGALFVELPRQWLTQLNSPVWLTTFISDGVGGGMQLVASFIPIIGALFLFQSFLESSGYMARAAFIVDRLMRAVGLPGKSFVPLIVGFGCNVPAVMSARILDSQGDRLLTTLMAPFMSCGARLTVYILFASVFFPSQGQNVVFALYLLGIIMAVATGFLVKKHIMHRNITPFIMELPNYHIPTIKGVTINAWHKLSGFMLRAGKAIILVVIVLNVVNSVGIDGSFGNQDSEKSALSVISMKLTPAFSPMGVQEENWPATVGIFSGIFAKEVVVGTLDTLYGAIATNNTLKSPEAFSLTESIAGAFATIPENLAKLGGMLTDPLGLNVGDLSDQASSAAAQNVELSTFSTMQALFGSAIAAFAYIVFVLLYMPCAATLGAIYKEAGGFWVFFSATWNTLIAYSLAVIIYQIGTFAAHPLTSLLWCAAMITSCVGGYLLLAALAKRQVKPDANLIPIVTIN